MDQVIEANDGVAQPARQRLTLEGVRAGDVRMSDVTISAPTLVRQADLAVSASNPQLGESLRRAAEMTALSDAELLAIYDALRPGRSSAEELLKLAADLEGRGMPRCSDLIREAADVYPRSRLCR